MAIETEPICWLDVPGEDEVPDEVKELWAKPLEKLGFVPNVLRVYAIRPRHLQLWNEFYDELMRGESGLTKAQREMIAVVVSTANRCHYCIVSHSAALRKLTGDPILVEQLADEPRVREGRAEGAGDARLRASSSPSGRRRAPRRTSRRCARRAGATRT